ncbi:alkaline phosphatase family protein [Nocardioides conyzicola]|uniref:Alkaline phosphatase n=1 Tax=Nocardioides conyzicola TaxID=1651781 RepID=A0ABP8WWQ0_9ACTN
MASRLGPLVCVLTLTLLVPTGAASGQTSAPPLEREPVPSAMRVLAISVDGLNTDAIRRLGTKDAPTFHRLLREGAGTLNARTEYEQNVTLPNHTGMMTGRRVDRKHGGHGVTWDDDRPRMTVGKAAGHSVESVFSVVHAAGGTTALFSTKEKFALYQRSWPRSIDRYSMTEDQAQLVRWATSDLVSTDRPFTFLHVSLPDRFGHAYGGMSKQYLAAVHRTDRQLGALLRAVDGDPDLADHLTVILTADHGFMPGRTTHSPKVLANYRIPFVAWGAGVSHGDLYALNPDYRDPGTTRPTYAARRQPVRNGDQGNLALDLLGLRAIKGSELDARQNLDVS